MVAALMVAFFTPGRQISPQLAGYSRSVTSSVAGKAVEKCYDRPGHGTGTTPCFQTGLKSSPESPGNSSELSKAEPLAIRASWAAAAVA